MKPSMKPSLKKPKDGGDIFSTEQNSPLRDDLSGSGSGTERNASHIHIQNIVDNSIQKHDDYKGRMSSANTNANAMNRNKQLSK